MALTDEQKARLRRLAEKACGWVFDTVQDDLLTIVEGPHDEDSGETVDEAYAYLLRSMTGTDSEVDADDIAYRLKKK